MPGEHTVFNKNAAVELEPLYRINQYFENNPLI
jgi:hypothetical protein